MVLIGLFLEIDNVCGCFAHAKIEHCFLNLNQQARLTLEDFV